MLLLRFIRLSQSLSYHCALLKLYSVSTVITMRPSQHRFFLKQIPKSPQQTWYASLQTEKMAFSAFNLLQVCLSLCRWFPVFAKVFRGGFCRSYLLQAFQDFMLCHGAFYSPCSSCFDRSKFVNLCISYITDGCFMFSFDEFFILPQCKHGKQIHVNRFEKLSFSFFSGTKHWMWKSP